jgi:hypothetical protein
VKSLYVKYRSDFLTELTFSDNSDKVSNGNIAVAMYGGPSGLRAQIFACVQKVSNLHITVGIGLEVINRRGARV